VSNEAPTTSTTAVQAYADPAPLGLAGFGLTTLVLSFGNANIIKEAGAIEIVFGLAVFYGGICQLLAGILEYRRGNTFGVTAFSSYGAFWLSVWYINTHLTAASGDVHQALGLFLIGWAVFTAYMTIAALKTNAAVLAVFTFLTLTFLFLALGAFNQGTTIGNDSLTNVGGYLGIVTGVLDFYASAAGVINATHKRDFLPVWPR
jgi:hypothetical protein